MIWCGLSVYSPLWLLGWPLVLPFFYIGRIIGVKLVYVSWDGNGPLFGHSFSTLGYFIILGILIILTLCGYRLLGLGARKSNYPA